MAVQLTDRKHHIYYAVPIPANSNGILQPINGAVLLGGFSFVESTGAAVALIRLWDGGNTGGNLNVVIALAAGVSVNKTMPGLGLLFNSGLTISVAAGAVEGALWVAEL